MDFGGGGFGGGGGHHHSGGGFDSGPASGGFSSADDNRGRGHGGRQHSGGSFGAGFSPNHGGFGGHESGGSFATDYFRRDGNNWRSHFGWGPVIAAGAAGAAVAGATAIATRMPDGRVAYYAPGQVPPGHSSQWQSQPYPELTNQQPRSSGWLKLLPIINIGVMVVVLYLLFFSFSSDSIELGVKEQRLLEANSFFVKSIKVTPNKRTSSDVEASLLGFKSPPHLMNTIHWQEHFYATSVRAYGYERWKFWLNAGSSVTLHYNIQYSKHLMLAVLKGVDRMEEWKYSPTTFTDYETKKTLAGVGSTTFIAETDGEYYVALGNFNNVNVMVYVLDVDVASKVYDLSRPDSHCNMPPSKSCSLNLEWGSDRVAVLATPLNSESEDLLTVQISYSTRWMTYFWIIALTWFSTYIIGKVHKRHEARRARQLALVDPQYRPGGPATSAPLTTPSGPESAALLPPRETQPVPPPSSHRRSFLSRVPILNRLSSIFHSRGFGWKDEEAQGVAQSSRQAENFGGAAAAAPIPQNWVATSSEGAAREANQQKGSSSSSAYVAPGPREGTPSGSGSGDTAPSAPQLDVSKYVHEGVVVKAGGAGEGQQVASNDACAICMDAKKDAILIDCGHRATCFSCGKMLLESKPPLCPICRKGIRQVIKVYDA